MIFLHHLRYKKMSPQWTRKWFENRKRKTCSLSKTMQHHHPFLLQRISKVGIISTSPCLFWFPRKFQKFPESFEIFVVSSTPDPVTHINPPSPEAEAKAKARGRLLCLHMLAQHLGANEGDAAAAPAHPGFFQDAGCWGGWFFRNFVPSKKSAETPGDVSPKNVAKVKTRLLGVLFL